MKISLHRPTTYEVGRSILIVEDNPFNADMLSRRLKKRGFAAVVAEDGARALAAVRTNRPDLILMDISLPEMDGWEATRRLKADAATREIPVIALTASAMVSDRDASLAAGCSEFETKPVDLARLIGKINQLLGTQ